MGISAAVGAISGGVAATGFCAPLQAVITAGATFMGDVATQKFCDKKSWGEVNYLKAAHNGVVVGGCSLLGSMWGEVTSFGHAMKGEALLSAGKDKLLTGYARRFAGQSSAKLLRQGRSLVSAGIKSINTSRGISSVTGTLLTWGVARKYTWN